MKKQYYIYGGIVLVVIVLIGIFGFMKHENTVAPEETALTGTTTSTGTASTTLTFDDALSSSSPLVASNFTLTNPALKTYSNAQFGFTVKYPSDGVVVTPSAKTPGLYRNDREFAFCAPELKTASGACAPILTITLPDRSGHGVSIYVLDNAKVQAAYPETVSYVRVNEKTNRRFEVYFSDTISTSATPAQNKTRQDLMGILLGSFLLK
jgi:hypothetical protein